MPFKSTIQKIIYLTIVGLLAVIFCFVVVLVFEVRVFNSSQSTCMHCYLAGVQDKSLLAAHMPFPLESLC